MKIMVDNLKNCGILHLLLLRRPLMQYENVLEFTEGNVLQSCGHFSILEPETQQEIAEDMEREYNFQSEMLNIGFGDRFGENSY
jgi:hypothetical protein